MRSNTLGVYRITVKEDFMERAAEPWWKRAVIYQIFPRSFKDTNGDGIGDLRGISEKLDYLEDLGVDAVWLSPIYDSPLADMGYDVRDYFQVHPDYGTMADFEELVAGLHARGMKLMMDAPVNHTSDEHEWFTASSSSPDSPYRDYYFWRDGKGNGEPPTQWKANFGGCSWEWEEKTKQYYLNLFQPKQPDLNWDNPKVREGIQEFLAFWLEKGVDGFRMDMINLISKDQRFPEGEPLEGSRFTDGSHHYRHGPRVNEFLRELNEEVLTPYQAATVGEAEDVTPQEAREMTQPERRELDMVFPFDHVEVDDGKEEGDWQKLDVVKLKQAFVKWHEGLPVEDGWVAWFWNSHDQARIVSRYGDDGEFRAKSAMMLAANVAFMRGTLFLFQGEEIGMTNAPFDSLDEYPDPMTHSKYREKKQQGWSDEKFLHVARIKARDHGRLPMQWDGSRNAGFTSGTPWMKMHPDWPEVNLEADRESKPSVFRFYQELLAVRKQQSVIFDGDFRLLWPEHPDLFAYVRENAEQTLLVLCNYSEGELAIPTEGLPFPLDEAVCLLTNKENHHDIREVMESFETSVYNWSKRYYKEDKK